MTAKLKYALIAMFALLFVVMLSFSIFAAAFYPGSRILFISYCLVFISFWGLAWVGYKSYFYMFFSTFTLLGFWMKSCAHLISGREFIEPVGSFVWSGPAWDKAIVVSIVVGLAILLFRIAQMYVMRRDKGVWEVTPERSYVPIWYERYRMPVWLFSFALIAFVVVVNFMLGINQAGMLPKVHLPFKINAIVNWCLYSAFAFWVSVLVWWDVCLGFGFRFEALIAEGILCSITIFSRSLYVTHVFNHLFSSLFNWKNLRLGVFRYLSMGVLFVAGFGIVLVSVAELRKDRFYGEVSRSQVSTSGAQTGRASTQFFLLLSERWIGLEGVMSTSSHSGLGGDLFKQGWLDMPSYERKPIYEYVSNSIYISPDYPDAKKYNFLSIPGLAAMLHLSGSLMVVWGGVFVLMIVFSASEYFVFRVLHNPFVLSLYGMIAAMMLHQFGGLYVNLIQLFELTCMFFFLWLITDGRDGIRMVRHA